MRTYKKKHNKNNITKNKNKIKGGTIPGMPNPRLFLKLAPILSQLSLLAPRFLIVATTLSARYSNPIAIVDLSTKLINGLVNNKTILEQLLKKDDDPNPINNTDYKEVYKEFINILKGIEGEAISLFEKVISILCGNQKILKDLLSNPQLSTVVMPAEQAMKFVGTILDQQKETLKSNVENINKGLSAKFSFILKNIIECLNGELADLITKICEFTSGSPSASPASSTSDARLVTGTPPVASKAGELLTLEDIKELRHKKVLFKGPKGPVEVKGNKLIVDPEKLDQVLHGEDVSFENNEELFDFLFNKHDGIEIEKLTVEKKYPLRIDVQTNKSHPLRFILVPDSEPLSYQLASNQKIKKKEMVDISMPEFLRGNTEIHKDKKITQMNVQLKNFKLKYKKVFEGDIKKPYNFFNVIDDIRNPMYVLEEKIDRKLTTT